MNDVTRYMTFGSEQRLDFARHARPAITPSRKAAARACDILLRHFIQEPDESCRVVAQAGIRPEALVAPVFFDIALEPTQPWLAPEGREGARGPVAKRENRV